MGKIDISDTTIYLLQTIRNALTTILLRLSTGQSPLFLIICSKLGANVFFSLSGGKPDYLRAAVHFIAAFRRGDLGNIVLDR